jgi:hypothetical protein
LSRLFKIYRDISTLSRLFEVLQDQKSRQIEKSRSRNVIKLTNSRSRSRQTVKICKKCHVSTDFSISIETFGTGRWCRDKIEISWSRSRCLETYFLKLSRFSQLSRLTFFWCRDWESWTRPRQDKSRPPTLQKTKRKTKLQLTCKKTSKKKWKWVFKNCCNLNDSNDCILSCLPKKDKLGDSFMVRYV